MTGRHRSVTGEEEALWREAMRDAKPLRRKRSAAAHPPVAAPAAQPAAPAIRDKPAGAKPRPSAALAHSRPAELARLDSASAPGLDKRSRERLRRGERAIEASLDLHGMTQEAAHAALVRFVTVSAAAGRRCVLVVTGKGTMPGSGVLKAAVPRWLNEAGLRPHLLAFVPAQPRHGGDGALYILLRRKR